MIDSNNFIQIAINSYDNPQCKTIEQFREDVFKFSMVKKFLKTEQYHKEHIRLTLNTITSLYNVFEYKKCTLMLFFKVRPEHWYKLKTYLVFLGNMPDKIEELNIISSDISLCQKTATELRMI